MKRAPAVRLAACYYRSSKDRHDVSIESQRQQLREFALAKGLRIVAEFADVVESGKDEHRPGFQQMLAEMRRPGREWSVLLLLDTSRLARRRLTSVLFEDREAKEAGVTILYKNLPEIDAAESMLLRNALQGLDEYHSLVSRRKGLAGMATNVANGYRAGGRAPRGYKLRHIGTGTIREGKEVMKSVLEPSADAPLVARYLKGRAAGRSRRALIAELGITWPETSLIGIEWNALTYAGHTVWFVHAEFERGRGYVGGTKRRPREEWHITRNTHPALITDEEAEAILAQLEQNPYRHSRARRTSANYLLTGLLVTPEGEPWRGNGDARYRARSAKRSILREEIEAAVIERLISDLRSRDFAQAVFAEAKRYLARRADDPAAPIKQQLAERTAQISRMMDLAARMRDPDPALREIERLEAERKKFEDELARLTAEDAQAAVLRGLTEEQVYEALDVVARALETHHRETRKDILAELLDRIELCPESLECRLYYRDHADTALQPIDFPTWNKVASPRRCVAIPLLQLAAALKAA